jgi:oxygen-independent coproporphyrinogen-3 oxidase
VRHIYVHVPFCRRRCVYCDFAIAVRREVPTERYLQAVRREVEVRADMDGWDESPVETLYLGGGTPSLLPPEDVARLVELLLEPAGRGPAVEVTLEANPDDASAEAARRWAAAGINRVSLGAQSFDDRVLRWMHRTHDARASVRAVERLRAAGIASISLDLIFGLTEGWGGALGEDLRCALGLEPDHLSLYGLTVEDRTPLGKRVARRSARPAAPERYEREFLLAHDTLGAAGFEHYEVSNYARPGRRSRHNASYWSGSPYAGLGPGAHSFRGDERRWNRREWAAYELAVRSGLDPVEGRETLDPQRRRLERLYLGLRTAEGVPRSFLAHEAEPLLRAGELQGWIALRGGRVRLTPEGWLRLDGLAAGLTTSGEGG